MSKVNNNNYYTVGTDSPGLYILLVVCIALVNQCLLRYFAFGWSCPVPLVVLSATNSILCDFWQEINNVTSCMLIFMSLTVNHIHKGNSE